MHSGAVWLAVLCVLSLGACRVAPTSHCLPAEASQLIAPIGRAAPNGNGTVKPSAVRLYVDVSTGMKGFFVPTGSAARSALLGTEHRYAALLDSLLERVETRQLTIAIRQFGTDISDLELSAFKDSLLPTCRSREQCPSIYNNKNISTDSDISLALNEVKQLVESTDRSPGVLHIISTDLFLERDDQAGGFDMYGRPFRSFIDRGLSVAIVGVRSAFNGWIFNLASRYNPKSQKTESLTYQGTLPAYFLVIGDTEHVSWFSRLVEEELNVNLSDPDDPFAFSIEYGPLDVNTAIMIASQVGGQTTSSTADSLQIPLRQLFADNRLPESNVFRFSPSNRSATVTFRPADEVAWVSETGNALELQSFSLWMDSEDPSCERRWVPVYRSRDMVKDPHSASLMVVHPDGAAALDLPPHFVDPRSIFFDVGYLGLATFNLKRKSQPPTEKLGWIAKWGYTESEEQNLVNTAQKGGAFRTRRLEELLTYLDTRMLRKYSEQENRISAIFGYSFSR